MRLDSHSTGADLRQLVMDDSVLEKRIPRAVKSVLVINVGDSVALSGLKKQTRQMVVGSTMGWQKTPATRIVLPMQRFF